MQMVHFVSFVFIRGGKTSKEGSEGDASFRGCMTHIVLSIKKESGSAAWLSWCNPWDSLEAAVGHASMYSYVAVTDDVYTEDHTTQAQAQWSPVVSGRPLISSSKPANSPSCICRNSGLSKSQWHESKCFWVYVCHFSCQLSSWLQ